MSAIKIKLFFLAGFLVQYCMGYCQNVGIDVDDPIEKLQVHGMVYTDSAGYKFPDGSVQTRAYNAYEVQDAAESRWVVLLENSNLPGSYSYGDYNDVIKVIGFSWGYFNNAEEAAIPISDPCHFKLVTIRKEIDESSPLFFQKYINGNTIGPTKFHFFWYDTQAQAFIRYYLIEFSDMMINSVITDQIYTGSDGYAHVEEIEFFYPNNADIQVRWIPSNIMYQFQPQDCQ
jgi:type VI protein secretion system component Hcp